MNRRNILSILGLATVSSSTMSVESLDTLQEHDVRSVPGLMQSMNRREVNERIAVALENMAKAIRSGEMFADKIEVISTATVDDWMRHEVRVHCEVALPDKIA